MYRNDIIEKGTSVVKDIDKDCTNRWHWKWLEKKRDDIPFSEWCRKLKECGKAYCLLCRSEISYGESGARALADHAGSKKHMKHRETTASNYGLPRFTVPAVDVVQRRCLQGYKLYNQEDIDKAVDMVHEGATLIGTEKASGVPYSTIRRVLKKCRAHPGPCKGAKFR